VLTTAPPITPIEVFYSYSHRDEDMRERLNTHLSPLKQEGVISAWYDRAIAAGSEWQSEIDTHLDTADLILLLVSADFIASDYCYGVEMSRALQRHEAGEARVIPIILKPVDWQHASFAKLQVLPTTGKPITTWRNRDEAFLDVARGIRMAQVQLTDPDRSRLQAGNGRSHREAVSQESQEASKGLDALSKIVRQTPSRLQEAIKVRTAFDTVLEQVDILDSYKELHDLLHSVQLRCYNLLLPKIKRVSIEDNEWEEIVGYDQELAECVGRLRHTRAQRVLDQADISPLLQLVRAQQELHQAVEEMDSERLRTALYLMKPVVGSQPRRINERLVATADKLRLQDLAVAMQRIQEQSGTSGLDVISIRELEVGRDSLSKLHKRLEQLVDAHKRWQWIDDQLRMPQESRDEKELGAVWPEVGAEIARLCAAPQDPLERPLVDEVIAACTYLNQNLAGEDQVRIWLAFLRVRGAQLRRFYMVDNELKHLCGELRKLAGPLTHVVGRLA
jgi:hypothetical protein